MNRPLLLGSLFYAGVGGAALIAPERVPATFGGTASTPDSRTEIRAVYGGLPLAIAAHAALSPRTGATSGALLSLGMAAGRAVGARLEGEASPATYAFLALEILAAGALAAGAQEA